MIRHGDWMLTYTGVHFYPLDPRPEEVCIEDIAHALGNFCRFGGHSRTFYSVAQHSVIVSRLCKPTDALWGLLHDAAEAYCGDVIRPLKYQPELSAYRNAEKRIVAAVAVRFGLVGGAWSPVEIPNSVHCADEEALAWEARDVMGIADPVAEWHLKYGPPSSTLVAWTPEYAKICFLRRFDELTKGRFQ